MRWRQFVPAAFVLALLLAAAAAFTPIGPWPLVILSGFYLAAVAAASVVVARRSGWRLLPGLPVAFGALHLAYGAGFVGGLVRFANRWFARPPAAAPLVLGRARRS
jgi:hypothetical protein